MAFGKTLKSLREKHGLSRNEVAKKLGLSYWAISKYETDSRVPDYGIVKELASIYDVSIDFLYGQEEKYKESPYPSHSDPFLDDLLKKVPDLTDEEKESLEEHMQFAVKIIEKERQRRAVAQNKDGDLP